MPHTLMVRSSEALAPEDMFFFRYFSQKDERQSDAKRKAKAKEMDERREREEMEEVEEQQKKFDTLNKAAKNLTS